MMQTLKKIQTAFLAAFAACSMLSINANAAVLSVDSGALMGIDDININGVLYDIDFGDGLWHEIDGIAAQGGNPLRATDFLLTSAELEIGLREIKTLLDGPDGSSFKNAPTAVNGCTSANGCTIHTPYMQTFTNPTNGNVSNNRYTTERFRISPVTTRRNGTVIMPDVTISVPTAADTFDDGNFLYNANTSATATYGVWSLASVSAVPEPSTYAMLLAGGLLVLAARKRQTV